MKKLLVMMIALVLGFGTSVKADEGMWIPLLINKNIAEMQEMGLKLSAEDIYSVNNSSLKDAIIIFGGGCTGEIISPEGLILTNHHCGYGSIQQVSTVEHDYLTDGFWSTSKEEEIPVEGLSVKFLVKMEDATARSLEGVNDDMTEDERSGIIGANIKKIVAEATEENDYNATVKSFFGGNEYYLFVYEVFTDIRLVGTPPESIGKFGADTDNWMWPRHTGDFSIFRVYTSPDGKPADFSEENVPMKSKHFLPVNIAGVEKGDFAMIMGNPGGTERYLSSYGVDLAVNQSNMTIVDIRAEKLRTMKEGMEADEAVRLQYASKYARTANYWKYFIGQTKGLKRLKVKEKKEREEAEFMNWVNKSAETKAKYGETLNLISDAYDKIKETNLSKWYFIEGIYRGPEILGYAYGFNSLKKELEKKKDEQDATKIVERLQSGVADHFKNYNVDIDRNMFARMMKMYHENVPIDQQPVFLLEVDKKFKGDYNKYAEYVFDKSIFGDENRVIEFLENPKAKTLKKDPALKAVSAFITNYRELAKSAKEANTELAKGERLYIAGLREMSPDKNFYPDANFTMRLTYGTVEDYYPEDAVHYNYYTTMDGIMQKEDPNNFEFIVPEKLKEIYENKDFGPYANKCGSMNVCFLTTHDITGGNSGSPVINGKGELIGLAFDGNWEAMSGDIAFEPELQRTINVDIRYVMLIIDKFAGAQNIIDELTIINKRPCKPECCDKKEMKEQKSEEMLEEAAAAE
ncbi:MAG: serine protease [Marinilabiliales bacterium]|nr:MAG: serine protease [Marinilabiliales bacterium]